MLTTAPRHALRHPSIVDILADLLTLFLAVFSVAHIQPPGRHAARPPQPGNRPVSGADEQWAVDLAAIAEDIRFERTADAATREEADA